jgi:hypothetical protein
VLKNQESEGWGLRYLDGRWAGGRQKSWGDRVGIGTSREDPGDSVPRKGKCCRDMGGLDLSPALRGGRGTGGSQIEFAGPMDNSGCRWTTDSRAGMAERESRWQIWAGRGGCRE